MNNTIAILNKIIEIDGARCPIPDHDCDECPIINYLNQYHNGFCVIESSRTAAEYILTQYKINQFLDD
jgi:hypothetical protein